MRIFRKIKILGNIRKNKKMVISGRSGRFKYLKKLGTRKRYVKKSVTPIIRKKSSLRRYIKNVMGKEEETKQKSETITDAVLFNGAISTSGECYDCLPDIARGTTSFERDGDKISPMYLTLRFIMQLTSGMPIHAQLFVLEDKLNRVGSSTRDYNFLNLNGTDVGFDGTWTNSGYPVNTEDFKLVTRKRIRLAFDQQPGGTGTSFTEDGVLFKEFKVKIPIRKLHKYLDYWGSPSTDYQPKNCNLFWAIGYTNADGTVDTISTRLKVTCISTLYYKDA